MASGLSRVTVVAPRSRVDLALPSDVPLADLLPTVLRYAGTDLAEDAAARHGWTLSRLGGVVLDSSHTPAQLDVRDGELLYLRPRGDDAPRLVFDDVVDAVATAARDRAGRWTPATTRVVGLAVGTLVLLAGAAGVLLAGPPHPAGAATGLAMAAVLTIVAVVMARAVGDRRAAIAFALDGIGYAGVGGLLLLAGDRSIGDLSAPHVLVAATMVVVFTVVAAVGVADAGPVFLCVGICAAGLFVAAAVASVSGAGVATSAAVTVTVALAFLPVLPMLAYRLGRLPMPSLPGDADQLRRDDEPVDAMRVLGLADRADDYLAALLTALSVVGGVAAVAVWSGGVPGVALSTVLGLLFLARARWFGQRKQRLPLLVSGVVALSAAAVTVAVEHPGARLLVAVAAAVAVAGASVGFALAAGRRPSSPLWGRALDMFEVVLILAVIPLALWVADLYSWIRSIRG